MLGFLIGLLGGVGIFIGIWSFITKHKVLGIIELALAIIPSILALNLINKRASSGYGGSDWAYLWDSVVASHSLDAWLIVVMYGLLILVTVFCFFKIMRGAKQRKK